MTRAVNSPGPDTPQSWDAAIGGEPTLLHAGKVRRLYAWPGDRILMVATDAISAFDHVLATPIPDKGVVLTQLSLWWFDQLRDLIPQPRGLHRRTAPSTRAGRWWSRSSPWCRSSAWPAAT